MMPANKLLFCTKMLFHHTKTDVEKLKRKNHYFQWYKCEYENSPFTALTVINNVIIAGKQLPRLGNSVIA